MKLAWLTDLHLDLVDEETIDELFDSFRELDADIVLSGGDVGRSETFGKHLKKLARRVERPVYFVLGNHDYYGSSLAAVRQAARELSQAHPHLHWLPEEDVIRLTDHTALIGHGLWGDGRAGNAERSTLELADHHLIEDLVGVGRERLFVKLNDLGEEAAEWTERFLERALEGASHVIFLTHVPPFAGPRRTLDRASSGDELPFYICTAVGEVILELMAEHPERRLTVLSGHRHIAIELDPAPNVHVITAGATYLQPRLQQVLEVG